MTRLVALLMVCAVFWLHLGMRPANAHALQPGFLEITSIGGDNYRVLWRKPSVQGSPMQIEAELPDNCEPRSAVDMRFDGVGFVDQWIAVCDGGIAGEEVFVRGLSKTATDVLVRYSLGSGNAQTHRLTPDAPEFELTKQVSRWGTFTGYFGLGMEHILEGYDHLLFVFALLLLIPDLRRLIGAVTAFTVAHSITLAAATLGIVFVPTPPVEAVIALSIMFLASEIALSRAGRESLTERRPWVVAFCFGLLHGLGFAKALKEIGLPDGEVPLALFAFNVGVEAGQLAFIFAVVSISALFIRVVPRFRSILTEPGSHGRIATSYAIGGIASFWFIERLAGF